MKKFPMMSWNDRFALIDHYKPSNLAICAAFNLTANELNTATQLREAGTFAPNQRLDATKFAGIFPDVDDATSVVQPTSTPIQKVGSITTHVRPETATKKVVAKIPQKRGRKGDKISQALFAVTDTPIPVEQFTKDHDISVAVLRQAKRFTESMTADEIEKIGKIHVKQDKNTKILMIWREDL